MPFGQIEQSWFEDDLWSLHSLSISSMFCQAAKLNPPEDGRSAISPSTPVDVDSPDSQLGLAHLPISGLKPHRS
ncbi:hypothetical protein [Pantanalinema sp. GBBB05]|uniref:hypothetical protein n=1 Tax=Pantanalinema sp. GBBB05 TaxID=2604139 RepID=UPI001DACC8A0|nr:hypothetical protein [Pantanalinema sp. GBBB05]